MSYLVVLIVDNVDQYPAVLDAWEQAGVKGVTILESTGLARVREAIGHRDDVPLMPSIRNLLQSRESHHRTLFTLIEDETLIDRLIQVTEAVIGDLTQPYTGVFFVLPVVRVHGVQGWNSAGPQHPAD
jgi:hypothetical protein